MTHSRKLLLRLLALLVASVMVFLVYTVTLTIAGDGESTSGNLSGHQTDDEKTDTTGSVDELPEGGVGDSGLVLNSTINQEDDGDQVQNGEDEYNQGGLLSSLSGGGGSSVEEGDGTNSGLPSSDDMPSSPVVFAYVIGPSRASTLTDSSATYTFSLQNIPADVIGLEFDYRIEGLYFLEKDSIPVGGWDIVEETGWALSGGYMTKSVILDRVEVAGGGAADFFKTVLAFTGECGLTTVEIVNAAAIFAGESVPIVVTDSFQTEISPFSIFDVNEDNNVDLADFASAVYFFSEYAGGESWTVYVAFEDEVGGILQISPVKCDVNGDGKIDLEDLILIRNNYSRDAVQLPEDEELGENNNGSSGAEGGDDLEGDVEGGDDGEENDESGLEEPGQGEDEEGSGGEAEIEEGLPEDEV